MPHSPFVELLKEYEGLSNCKRRHVSCLLIRNGQVVSIGVNGSRWPLGCARPNEMGNCGCTHAEVMAGIALREREAPDAAYISAAPCEPCAKVLANIGVKHVYFIEDSRPMAEGFAVLDLAGIGHTKIG